ncbi:hypothetical protein LCGC14_2650750, partial [marine sediment metagenome]
KAVMIQDYYFSLITAGLNVMIAATEMIEAN